jgi:hypothetical protein
VLSETMNSPSRRELCTALLMLPIGTAISTATAYPALADEVLSSPPPAATAGPSSFTDSVDQFSLTVPEGWAFGEGVLDGNRKFSGASGSRRTLAWVPTDGSASTTNVTVVVTNVGADYQSLGSFGSAYTFGTNLVNSMDRSYLLKAKVAPPGPIMVAKLVDAKEIGSTYSVEYTVQQLPEPQRHLKSRVALGYNGTYNRLYTLTAQCLEEDRGKYSATLDAVIKSFTPPPN